MSSHHGYPIELRRQHTRARYGNAAYPGATWEDRWGRGVVDAQNVRAIGARARLIRDRRGLSLEVVGGLAGISGPYLSMLERGLRGFNRRGLLEDLAEALGCSVADLTGQPSVLLVELHVHVVTSGAGTPPDWPSGRIWSRWPR